MKRKINSCKECKIKNCEKIFDNCNIKNNIYIFEKEEPELIKRFDIVDNKIIETLVGVIDIITGTESQNFITLEQNKINKFEKINGEIYPKWETIKIKKL